jgi:hypothetical protein
MFLSFIVSQAVGVSTAISLKEVKTLAVFRLKKHIAVNPNPQFVSEIIQTIMEEIQEADLKETASFGVSYTSKACRKTVFLLYTLLFKP